MTKLHSNGASDVASFIDFTSVLIILSPFFLFQAVLADLSTLKVMPLLQIFLFATVT
jgi:hypothetical protein